MGINIRSTWKSDIETLVRLMGDFYKEFGTAFDRDRAAFAFDRLMSDAYLGKIWIAEENHTALGYVILTLGFSMEYGGTDAFVDDLYIRPAYRKAGLGSRLLETLMTECRRRGVRAVHLEVGRDNADAKRLYGRFEFKETDRQLLTCRLQKPRHER
jgi:ribosomal protein S18 acetylase RimI-like enzyme